MGKGYLLPADVEPEMDNCLILFYPDAPEYRRALLGAYATFGAWVLWERDGTNRASLAATRWKSSILRTLAVNQDNELCQSIDEEGNMAINVTVNTNCGSGCGCGNGGTMLPPDWRYNPGDLHQYDDPPGLSDYPSQVEYDQARCDLSGMLVDDYIDTIGEMATLSAFAAASGTLLFAMLTQTAALSGVLAGVMALGVTAPAAMLLLIGAFVGLVVFGIGSLAVLSDASINMRSNREDIICQVYNAQSGDEMKQVLVDAMDNALAALLIDDATTNAIMIFIVQAVDSMLPDEILTAVLKASKDLRADFTPESVYDCVSCQSASGTAVFDFELSNGGWEYTNRAMWDEANGVSQLHAKIGQTPAEPKMYLSRSALSAKTSVPNPAVSEIRLVASIEPSSSWPGTSFVDITVYFEDLTSWSAAPAINGAGSYTFTGMPVKALRAGTFDQSAIQIKHSTGASFNNAVWLDDIELDTANV